MIERKNFSLNDQSYYTQSEITLFDIIHYFNYNDSLLVVEYNNLICIPKKWKDIKLMDQDKIEIVTIVGGG